MKIKHYIQIVSVSILFFRCANPVTPNGGVKDITAPKLIFTDPTDRSTNIKPKTVVFKFDENIQPNSIKEQVIISPLPIKKPKIEAGKNYVRVELDENTLNENSTYSIQLNQAIKDLNEGNPGNYMPLIFSTGTTIDTFKINGHCTFTEEPKTNKIKITSLEKNPKKTITNKTYQFTLPGLANDSIWLAAINDINGDDTWNIGEDVGLVRCLPKDSTSIVLYNTTPKKIGLIKYNDSIFGCYGKDIPRDGYETLLSYKDTLIGDSNTLYSFLKGFDTATFMVSKKPETKREVFSYYWKKPSFLKDSIQELHFIANKVLTEPEKIIYYIDKKQQKENVIAIRTEKNVIKLIFKTNQTGSIRIPNPFKSISGDIFKDTFKTSIPVYTSLNISNKESFDIYISVTNKNTSETYSTYIREGSILNLWALSGEHDIMYYHDKNKNKLLDGPDIIQKVPGEYFKRLPVLKIKENLTVDLDIKPTDKP